MVFISVLEIIILIIAIWIIIGFLWKFIRDFFHDNYSYFDLSFIITYFVEQFILIVLLLMKPEYMNFWVSAFALLVVTTVSIQKLAMDSRDRKIRELNVESKILLEKADESYEKLKEREKLHIDTINKLTEELKER